MAKKGSYICTPKTVVPGWAVHWGPFPCFWSENYFQKKERKDCGNGKRVLYLHPLKD